MVARGGGATDLEVILHPASPDNVEMMVVHLMVNTCDAMGANLVNTMCEGVASFLESISGGRGLSCGFCPTSPIGRWSRASVKIPVESLGSNGYDGEQVRDGIVIASQFAAVDSYRAVPLTTRAS